MFHGDRDPAADEQAQEATERAASDWSAEVRRRAGDLFRAAVVAGRAGLSDVLSQLAEVESLVVLAGSDRNRRRLLEGAEQRDRAALLCELLELLVGHAVLVDQSVPLRFHEVATAAGDLGVERVDLGLQLVEARDDAVALLVVAFLVLLVEVRDQLLGERVRDLLRFARGRRCRGDVERARQGVGGDDHVLGQLRDRLARAARRPGRACHRWSPGARSGRGSGTSSCPSPRWSFRGTSGASPCRSGRRRRCWSSRARSRHRSPHLRSSPRGSTPSGGEEFGGRREGPSACHFSRSAAGLAIGTHERLDGSWWAPPNELAPLLGRRDASRRCFGEATPEFRRHLSGAHEDAVRPSQELDVAECEIPR